MKDWKITQNNIMMRKEKELKRNNYLREDTISPSSTTVGDIGSISQIMSMVAIGL